MTDEEKIADGFEGILWLIIGFGIVLATAVTYIILKYVTIWAYYYARNNGNEVTLICSAIGLIAGALCLARLLHFSDEGKPGRQQIIETVALGIVWVTNIIMLEVGV